MSSLPLWISPRMLKALGIACEELLLTQFNGAIVITSLGITLQDNDGLQIEVDLNELCQNTHFLENILIENTEEIIFPMVVPTETQLEEMFNEIIQEPIETKIEEPHEEVLELRNRTVSRSDNTINQNESKKELDDEWTQNIYQKIKSIYNEKNTTTQRLVLYYQLGKLLNERPQRHSRSMSKLKKTIEEAFGKKLHEKPYVIAMRIHQIYSDEKEVIENRYQLKPTDILRMKNDEVQLYICKE
jgi:hypothetical protein